MLFTLSLVTALVALLIVLAPFVLGKGGALQGASSINSPEQLEKIKQSVLRRYLEDEKAYQDKLISSSVWKTRQQYLTNRYVDTARRLDFVKSLAEQEQNEQSTKDQK